MMRAQITFVFIWLGTLPATSDTLPEDWRKTYSQDGDTFVIETPSATLRWVERDWAGLSYQSNDSASETPVPLQEDGPAPDALIRFDTGLDLCGKSLGVAALVYSPNDLRQQPTYAWLRVIFDLNAPENNWQLWDIASDELRFGYNGRDIPIYYNVDCNTMQFTYKERN